MKYPINAFPDSVKRYIKECAEAVQVDQAGVGLSVLVGAASQIGNSCCLEIKNSDKRPCVLWGGVIGDSGIRKSAMISLPLKPLRQLQDSLFRIHAVRMDEWKEACRDAKRNQEMFPEEPVPEQPICTDVTMEAIGPLLQANPRGVLLHHDELAGHFGRMNSYNQGKDEAHWLAMYEAGPITVNRRGSKQPTYVERANISIIGGIQPGVFREVFKKEHKENGMEARFLWCIPERIETGWTDKEVSDKAMFDMQDVLSDLRKELPVKEGAEPFLLGFNAASLDLWKGYCNWHGKHLYKLRGHEAALFSKSEGHASRLSIVIHQMRYVCGETEEFYVDEIDLNAGIELAAYYYEQGRSLIQSPNQLLCEMIQSNGCRITPRELQAKNKRRYPTADDAERKLVEFERMNPPLLESKYSEAPARGQTGRYWLLTKAGFEMAGNVQQVFQKPEENNKFAANASLPHVENENVEAPF